jgi:hypothetical protein
MYTFHIVDTQSGVKQQQVFPASGSWSRLLNEGGRGSHTFVLTDDEPMANRVLSSTWSRALVVSWRGFAVYAGVIVKRSYDQPKNTLTISHEDYRTIFSRRYPFGVNGYWAPGTGETQAGTLTLTGLSLRASIIRVLQESLTGPFPSKWTLPIDLPPYAAEAGTNTETIEFFNELSTSAHIQNYQERSGGPDTDFEPVWSGGVLRLTGRIGSPASPSLFSMSNSGGPFEFNQDAAEPRLTAFKVTEDGQKQATGQFSVGTGSGRDMKVGGFGLGNQATIPALDVVQTYKEQGDKDILYSYAQGAIAVQRNPTVQYEMSLLANEEPGLENLRMGSILRVMNRGDLWLANDANVRLISISGDMTNNLTLDVQPWG